MADVKAVPARIAYLILLHLHNKLTPPEGDELDEWICLSDENMEIFEILTDIPNDPFIDPDESSLPNLEL
jgi:hypothetical protein